MNLVHEPWIPVVCPDASTTRVSLMDVFIRGTSFPDLAVRPYERVALMRLLLCISHAALEGPLDFEEWQKVPDRLPDAAVDYLNKWAGSFELFDPVKPFCQVADLRPRDKGAGSDLGAGWTPVDKLDFSRACGNMASLFDHLSRGEVRRIPPADLAVSFLAYLCFSPGGLISEVLWGGQKTSKSSKDGPCASASMYHAILRRENLVATLNANLVPYSEIERHYRGPEEEWLGRPLWERFPEGPQDQAAIRNARHTYLGRLVPLSRVIKLHGDCSRMLLGEGIGLPAFNDGKSPFPAEPTGTVVEFEKNGKPARRLLSFSQGKGLWREVPALSVERRSGIGGPLCLVNLRDEDTDMILIAMARKQAEVLDSSEAVVFVPKSIRSSDGWAIYKNGIEHAERAASRLAWAVEVYRRAVDGGWEGRVKSNKNKNELKSKLASRSLNHFWTSVEGYRALLLTQAEKLGTEEGVAAEAEWEEILVKISRVAYTAACPADTPRQMRAFAEGWRCLYSKKAADVEVEAATDETDEEEQEEEDVCVA